MNLRQKYKKAKQKIERLERKTVTPDKIYCTPYDVKTLRVTRILDNNFYPKYFGTIVEASADFMVKDMADELKKYWDFETVEDPETGMIKLIGTVRLLVDKDKQERS